MEGISMHNLKAIHELDSEFDYIKHKVGTTTSRLTSILMNLQDKEFILESENVIFSEIESFKKNFASLISSYRDEKELLSPILKQIRLLESDNPSIDELTAFFHKLAEVKSIFGANLEISKLDSFQNANIVATLWNQFSEFMPKFLSSIASGYVDNEERFSAVQIAWEELGEGNRNNIHAKIFRDAVEMLGIQTSLTGINCESLNILKNFLVASPSDKERLGIGLGLEIMANENISTLFKYNCFNKDKKIKLAQSDFFKIHFKNEDEHIASNIKNFTFCKSDKDKLDFIRGFKVGVKFWTSFWDEALNYIAMFGQGIQ